MAGDWIKMRGNLWDDPRVGHICDLCDTSEASVIGGLYWLWATADQHTEDGTMPGLSLRQIDRKTGVPGLAAALVDVGWLLDDPAGATIVKFEEHNGASAKKRCQTAKRVANFKAGNADETLDSESGNATSVSTALPREEKRREEKKEQQPKDKERSPCGSRLPADWVCPEEWLTHCTSERPDLDATTVACNFADYWHAKAGAGARKADWLATWRSWVRKESAPKPSSRSPPESFRERDERLAREKYEQFVGIRRPINDATIIEEVSNAPCRLG